MRLGETKVDVGRLTMTALAHGDTLTVTIERVPNTSNVAIIDRLIVQLQDHARQFGCRVQEHASKNGQPYDLREVDGWRSDLNYAQVSDADLLVELRRRGYRVTAEKGI